MVQENHMQVHFDAKSVNEGLARMVVTAFMTNMNPTLEQIADVKTAVSEAVTNAIIHGYEDETKQVELTCDQNGQQLVVTVEDHGVGRGSIQDHQLGEHSAHCRHDAHVGSPYQHGCFGPCVPVVGQRPWHLWSLRPSCGHLFHHFFAHHVHQQHGHGRAHGSHRVVGSIVGRNCSSCVPLCRYRGSKHVLCLAVLNAAKRSCHAGRPLHVYGLHSRGSSPSGHNGCCDGVCAAPAFPVLISVNEHLLYYNKATIINTFVIDRL